MNHFAISDVLQAPSANWLVTELTLGESLQISIHKVNNFQLTYLGKELHLPSNIYFGEWLLYFHFHHSVIL